MVNNEVVKNTIIKHLKQQKKFSFTQLKEQLFIYNDQDLYDYLLDILLEHIEYFNFETPISCRKHINKCIDYLEKTDNLELNNIENLIEKIKEIKNIAIQKIKKDFIKPNKKVFMENKKFLIDIIGTINLIIDNLKSNKEILQEYETLYDLVFELKSIDYLVELFNINPYIANIKNENYLFIDVIDKYFNLLINNINSGEFIYYNQVVNLFLKNVTDETLIQYTLYRTNKLLDNIEYKDIDEEKKKRILFFLKEIINFKNNIKEKSSIENLNQKYGILENQNQEFIKPDWKNYHRDGNYIVTIDSDNTEIYENALKVNYLNNGNILIEYYIVDINSYLDNNPILKSIVYDRVFSLKGYNLLPQNVTDKVSLKANKYSYVIAYKFIIDNDLKVINFEVKKKMIKVKQNLKYSHINDIVNDGNSKVKNSILNMREFSKRFKYGVDKVNFVKNYQIFLNHYIASYFYNNSIPFIYRNSVTDKKIEKLEDFKEKYQNYIVDDIEICIKNTNLNTINYSTFNRGHQGLKLDAYGEISHPLRSLPSIINQDLVIKYLIEKQDLNDEQLLIELKKQCNYINNKRDIYNNYIYETEKIKRKR